LVDLAAGQLEIAAEDLVLEEGRVRARDVPDRSLTYSQVVRAARQGNVLGQGTFTNQAPLDPVTGQPGASAHWHQGVGAAEVEVDTETGKVRLVRFHTGVFAGRAINPRQCELQTEGSLTMALGQALIEELAFDGGQMVNPNLGDYMLPSIKDLPPTITLQLLEEPGLDEFHGVGESTLPAATAAISNAVAAAIGRPLHELPITPERVLRALRADSDQRAQSPEREGPAGTAVR
jgi:CO/xanthine dehydrogenase Mo-binding subunit